MDEYLKVCQVCKKRSPARYFRVFHGVRICPKCVAFLSGGQYRPQRLSKISPAEVRPYEEGQPPSRWSERRRPC